MEKSTTPTPTPTAAKTRVLVYGAYGFTGHLVCEALIAKGLKEKIVLGGRSASKLEVLAKSLECPTRLFDISTPEEIIPHLSDTIVLVLCAGPFDSTAAPVIDACLRSGTHYVDISGELPHALSVLAKEDEAKYRTVAVMSCCAVAAVSDALINYLLTETELNTGEVTSVQSAIVTVPLLTPGSVKTGLHHLGAKGSERINGELLPAELGSRSIQIDLPKGPQTVNLFPSPELAFTWHLYGIPNSATFVQLSGNLSKMTAPPSFLTWGPVRRLAERVVGWFVSEPTQADRDAVRPEMWARAWNDKRCFSISAVIPDGYTTTGYSAASAVALLLGHLANSGKIGGVFTPAKAFGAKKYLDELFRGADPKNTNLSIQLATPKEEPVPSNV